MNQAIGYRWLTAEAVRKPFHIARGQKSKRQLPRGISKPVSIVQYMACRMLVIRTEYFQDQSIVFFDFFHPKSNYQYEDGLQEIFKKN